MCNKKKIEVCFSPAVFQYYKDSNAIAVVIDTLRASSAICNAFQNGVEKLIPVKTIDEARKYKKKGFIVAAERDGYVLDFADFGNSPFNFTEERVKGKTIVYSTTNGTQAIKKQIPLRSTMSETAMAPVLQARPGDPAKSRPPTHLRPRHGYRGAGPEKLPRWAAHLCPLLRYSPSTGANRAGSTGRHRRSVRTSLCICKHPRSC